MVKFAQATSSVNSKSLQNKASASNLEKAAKKAPRKVTLVLSKEKLADNEPAEFSGGSDDEDFEPLNLVMFSISLVYNLITIFLTRNKRIKEMPRCQHQQKQLVQQHKKRYGNCFGSFSTSKYFMSQEKRKMKDVAENEPPSKRQRKQVHYELEKISGGSDDEDFVPLKSVSFQLA